MAWLDPSFEAPECLRLETGHHLRQIREADAAIDYPVVMGSRPRLWQRYGEAYGWPRSTMTYEEDKADLARHEREMNALESFNYAILDAAETKLVGCLYIDPPGPDAPPGADATASWWVVDDAVGTPLELELSETLPRWLAEAWGFRAVHYWP